LQTKAYIASVFLFLPFLFWAQSGKVDTTSGQAKKINIRQADKGYYSKNSDKNRLIGNVVFEHEGALMYCDSAWLYGRENRIEAFEKVYINQGDTLKLWGDYLEYSGNTRKALVTGKTVKLTDPEMTLITNRLNYDRNLNLAYYTTGGEITNAENLLVSQLGYYNSANKLFNFKDSVRLTNPDYYIACDTLDYSSESRIAYFLGPTTITSDSSYIYCENGLYNTVKDVAQFEKNAQVYDGDSYLTGDSIYYVKKREYGEAYGNVLIHDTVENYLITGGYGEYSGVSDSAFVTLDPLYSIVDDENDTLHVHGDTLYSVKYLDSLEQSHRLVKVYFGVKFYKSSAQGKCDSLTYSSQDSTFRMYRKPVIWDDSTQITGDTIYMLTQNNKPDTLLVFQDAFMLLQVDSVKDNQVSGKTMTGKFSKDELRRVFVNGNGQTIYYPKEENGDFIGMNRSVSAALRIDLKESEVKKITFLKKPEGTLFPMGQIPQDQRKLDGFFPRFTERPTQKKDLFKSDNKP
jgi:lipopolysaccharide export system protein LptA